MAAEAARLTLAPPKALSPSETVADLGIPVCRQTCKSTRASQGTRPSFDPASL